MDEVDAITPKRETSSRGMEKRIVAQVRALSASVPSLFVYLVSDGVPSSLMSDSSCCPDGKLPHVQLAPDVYAPAEWPVFEHHFRAVLSSVYSATQSPLENGRSRRA